MLESDAEPERVKELVRLAHDTCFTEAALANPVPEVDPVEAGRHARVVATGRSDYPNQINNCLCFPGLFRGALDCRAREINEAMKVAAARAIAATATGVARRRPGDGAGKGGRPGEIRPGLDRPQDGVGFRGALDPGAPGGDPPPL